MKMTLATEASSLSPLALFLQADIVVKLVMLGLLAASIWTVWLWMTGLKVVPAAQAGVFTVMLPVSAAAIGVLFMGETLTPLQVVAFGIALSGLVLATLPQRRPAQT